MFVLPCGLNLRPFRANDSIDIEEILKLYNTPQIAHHIWEGFPVPRGEKLKCEFKDLIEKKAIMFCIIETIPTVPTSSPLEPEHLKFVGMTGLWAEYDPVHRHANFSIILSPDFHGKGFGKAITTFMIDYAFVQLNIHRVSLEVYEGNDNALALYNKVGFIEEGRQRKAEWKNGSWKDVIVMGILQEEWATRSS